MTFKKEPLVSICCQTYNHKDYIAKAIESFLMQKTNFLFEILLRDDASTDGTAVICKNYASMYPEIINPLIYEENQYSKGISPFLDNIKRAKGKYIALCEGDDYWTDPYKIQKQVDFLEANPDYSVGFHAAEHLNMNTGQKIICNHKCKNGFRTFNVKDAIINGGGFMTTNSMVFPSDYVKKVPEWYMKAPTGDYALSLFLSSQGKIAYFDDVMSAYRKGVEGSWTEKTGNIKSQYKWLIGTSKLLHNFNKWTNFKYSGSICKKLLQNRWNVYKYIIKEILQLIFKR